MRAVAAVVLVAAGGVALANADDAGRGAEQRAKEPHAAPGRVVRVERRAPREAFVPSGWFWMGVPDDDVATLGAECARVFEPKEAGQNPLGNGNGTFCGDYEAELKAMTSRRVYISAFTIDRDEVSVADYRACIAAGACSLDPMIAGDHRYIQDGWPMVNVTWYEAQDYCRWRGGRLPTEAEWERAARGDSSCPWPWGGSAATCVERPADFNHGRPRPSALRDLDQQNILLALGDPDGLADGHELLAPSGTYPWGDGPYGTRDQAGNVAEWTADALGLTDATLGYTGLPTINPRRDGSALDARVVRGGSWRQPAFVARADVRDPYNQLYEPDKRFSYIGFRCVQPIRDR